MVKVVIGCGENKNVLLAVKAMGNIKDLKINVVNSEEELISAFEDDSVDAIVRGSLKSSSLLKEIKNLNNLNNNLNNQPLNRMSFINFKNKDNKNNKPINNYNQDNIDSNGFLLGPVGIDEGKTIDEKLDLVIQGSQFMLDIGEIPKIAILAGGRKEDFGRSSNIDESIENSEKLVKLIDETFSDSNSEIIISNQKCDNQQYNNQEVNLQKSDIQESNIQGSNIQESDIQESDLQKLDFNENSVKYFVKNYYILIEKAINDKNNIIIAPDGIMGNIIFRSLVLLSSWKSNGAIALGSKKIFIDTSRDQSKEGYMRSLKFAYELAIKTKLGKTMD